MRNNSISVLCAVTAGMLSLFAGAVAEAAESPQEEYIEQWYRVAVSEMYRSGVPASITLAQGLLESGYGRSELAVRANNHFGIKCHDWRGQKVYFDDDRKGECFRKYPHAEASFRDHSDFLRYRDRPFRFPEIQGQVQVPFRPGPVGLQGMGVWPEESRLCDGSVVSAETDRPYRDIFIGQVRRIYPF